MTEPLEDQPVVSSIQSAVGYGVPVESITFFARWWQLEHWLRTLVYLELRSGLGDGWQRELPQQSAIRAERDEENAYRASPDASNPLAYLDSQQLFAVIGDDRFWPYFEPALLPRKRWDLLKDDLLSLRNRNAHYRRPHADDIARLEQALRDLEVGARRALRAHDDDDWPSVAAVDDALLRWLPDSGNEDHLLGHAARNYETEFSLRYARRPWYRGEVKRVAGTTGLIWKAHWQMSGRYVRPVDLWSDLKSLADSLVFVVHEDANLLDVSFSAVDNPGTIARTIEATFHYLLQHQRRYDETYLENWDGGMESIDYRVQVRSPLAMAWVFRDRPETSVFGVGR